MRALLRWQQEKRLPSLCSILYLKLSAKTRRRYVDYAMTRVRLLRHYKIEPYIVFDGGPLPAKRGTESDRKRKRDDNLAEANRLAAQGKHSQAREYYVKCVDVTPEMAYQFIKASMSNFQSNGSTDLYFLGSARRMRSICRCTVRGRRATCIPRTNRYCERHHY